MSKKLKPIKAGITYGQLTIIEEVNYQKGKPRQVLCKCDCGNTKIVRWTNLRNGHTKSCGCLATKLKKERRGENHPRFNGGRYKTGKGYILIRKPDHPNSRVNGEIFEHVYIMSEYLGRPLLKHENVHHKNGFKDDNRIENLELWSTFQPTGQRVEDKIKWAKEILEIYKDYNYDASNKMV